MKKFIIKVFIVILIVVVAIIVLKKNSIFDKKKANIITSSTLTDTINISNLSTSQFTYNGIAEIYKDEEKTNVKCHIRYKAKVKAGIDMEEVTFDIDKEKKTIRPILPEIKITSNTVDDQSLSYIPNNINVDLKDALIACQNDAISESKESSQLIESAENNLKSIIKALLLPIVSSQDYEIIWNE